MEEKNKKPEPLKNSGIRTMAKDIAKIREDESRKETERVTALQEDITKLREIEAQKEMKKTTVLQEEIIKLKEIEVQKEREERKKTEALKLERMAEKESPIKKTMTSPQAPPPLTPFPLPAKKNSTDETERIKREEERKKQEEKKRIEEEERKKQEEKKRIEEEERKKQEEKRRIEEEERKRQEEKRRIEEEERKKQDKKNMPPLQQKKEELNERELQLYKKMALISEEKKPAEEEKSKLLFEIEKIKKESLAPIIIKENEIKKEKTTIEEAEKKASFKRKKEIEERRWQIEEKREEIVKEKWQIEEEIIKIQEKIKEADLKISQALERERNIKAEIENIINEKEAIDLINKRTDLEKENNLINDRKISVEIKLEILIKKKQETEKVLTETLESERALEEEVEILEKKEGAATDLMERREIEKRRGEAEEERRKTEKEKWRIIKEKEDSQQEIENFQFETAKLKKTGEELEKKIKEIDASFEKSKERGIKIENLMTLAGVFYKLEGETEGIEGTPPKKESSDGKIAEAQPATEEEKFSSPPSVAARLAEEKEKSEAERIRERVKELLKEIKTPIPPTPFSTLPEETSDSKETNSSPLFVDAQEDEEVKSVLRSSPADQEIKERRPSPAESRKDADLTIEETSPEISVPEFSVKKPKPSQKIFIRGFFFILLFLLISFLYWFFVARNG